jgi:hypothetical protein
VNGELYVTPVEGRGRGAGPDWKDAVDHFDFSSLWTPEVAAKYYWPVQMIVQSSSNFLRNFSASNENELNAVGTHGVSCVTRQLRYLLFVFADDIAWNADPVQVRFRSV